MYKNADPKVNFPQMEEEILKFWDEKDIFKLSIENRKNNPEFVFYDGPPFATGLPHFGHFVPNTIKDIIPRFKTMKGYRVNRRFGWDCHGLPVEYEMEKELKISGKKEIEDYGVAKFNESCRSIVLRYTKEWRAVIRRLGRWVDFDHDYKTMDPDYMESIWWVVKQLWDKGLIYEGYYILPYCPRCSTVLSNHELNLGGYKDVTDPAVTVRFKIKAEKNTYILAWTTTPWTLPSNLGLTVGPEIEYVKIQDGEDFYILAKERLSAFYKTEAEYKIIKSYKGSELKGMEYEPLFDYFADQQKKGAFRIFTANFVSTEDGTGVVHTAPGFGEDDYLVFKNTQVDTVCPIDAECKFTEEVRDFKGLFVKDTDKAIIQKLKDEGKLVKREQILHSYPHCWRCKSPLVYRAISSWFVNVEKIKPKMIAANKSIYWMPEHLQQGRFGKWLENAREWAISRNRYWGNPIPVWKCDKCEKAECIGSRAELEKKSGKKVTDLHKHFVDQITYSCICGGNFKRIPEVLDCWFESGSMPYAQSHYPFENKEHFDSHFPADFIAEGLDQTRGWFYTLTVLAAALFDKPAFKSVVVNGLILAADGKKMSKSERNYSDPMKVMGEYGADAMRLVLMNSAVVRADDLKYSDEGVRDVLKTIILPLWNSYSFFVTYANIDKARPTKAPDNPGNPLDRWIISAGERLVSDVAENLEKYDLQKAISAIVNFIDDLNNWYIRRSRRRFWRSENDADKLEAYGALWSVLMKLVLCASPIIPFVTEEMYRNLRSPEMPESVHLCDYPVCNQSRRDPDLEFKMAATQKAVSMGRALRATWNLKNRQPLSEVHIVTRDLQEKKVLLEMEDIIREELNVKDVVFRDNEEDLVEYRAKANFKVLGKVLGKDMKIGAEHITKLGTSEIMSLIEGATLSVEIGSLTFDLTQEHVLIERIEKQNLKVLNEGTLTIALDTDISEELMQEGIVRDLVRGIQTLRKDSGLTVTDRIHLTIEADEGLKKAVEVWMDYLTGETLSIAVKFGASDEAKEVDCGGTICKISVKKA